MGFRDLMTPSFTYHTSGGVGGSLDSLTQDPQTGPVMSAPSTESRTCDRGDLGSSVESSPKAPVVGSEARLSP